MEDNFARLARRAAYATALVGIVYSIAFVTVVQRGSRWAEWTSALSLTAGGLLALPVLVVVTSMLGESRDTAGLRSS